MNTIEATDFAQSMQKMHDAASVSLSVLVTRHRQEYRALDERHQKEIGEIRSTMREFGITLPIKSNRENLSQLIVQIMGQNKGRGMKAIELKSALSAEGCDATYGTLYMALQNNAMGAWSRTKKGSYALKKDVAANKPTSDKRSSMRKGLSKAELFPHTYPQPLSGMVLMAIEHARDGAPVRKEDIRKYIESKWSVVANMGSISGTVYAMLPSGKLNKVRPGEFTIGKKRI